MKTHSVIPSAEGCVRGAERSADDNTFCQTTRNEP